MKNLLFLCLFTAALGISCDKKEAAESKAKAEETQSSERSAATEEGPETTAPSKGNEVEDAFWKSFRTSFMKSCEGAKSPELKSVSSAQMTSYCRCALEKFESAYPTMDKAMAVTKNPQVVQDLAKQCLNHLLD
ncbi:MAG: hypothetical protein KF690_03585 [Bacteroidetes bacterium]|nr:hypothetical protein [Bacteroidota bacterium]